jgi:3-isopropylmalate/(R)-2-methylmalate dehydratase small subunit
VTVVLAAGIRAVVAKSYSRTYWRNALNNGLLVLVADTSGIAEGDGLQVCLDGPTPELRVIAPLSCSIACEPMPEFMRAMREAGGLVPYLRLHGKLA